MTQKLDRKNPFSHFEIKSISKRLFTASEWIETFGKPIYYLNHVDTIKKLLLNNGISDEWDIIQHGERRRWFIYLSKDKIDSDKINSSRIKITPILIEKIRNTDFSEYGAQRRLAAKLEIDEGYLSKIRRELRRTEQVAAKKLTKKLKNELFIEKSSVESFFNIVLTGQEFINLYGGKYKLNHLSTIYRMCAGKKNLVLPENWHCIKVGEAWFLYYSEAPIFSEPVLSPK